MDPDHANLYEVANKAIENAKRFLNTAEKVAKDGNWGLAYALLTFCVEECAKSQICRLRSHDLNEIEAAKNSKREPELFGITKEKVISCFKNIKSRHSHEEKLRTVLTQNIMYLTNTHDVYVRSKVIEAIRKKDPFIFPDIEKLICVFNRVWEKRQYGLYVDLDGKGPHLIGKPDYDELLEYTKNYIRGVNNFRTIKAIAYDLIEGSVKEMKNILQHL